MYGSTDTSLLTGTPILNPVPFGQYNAPLFCSVCSSPQDSHNTDQGVLKGTLFAPTTSLGSHTVVAGGEFYKSAFAMNNWQSGSGYGVFDTDVIHSNGDLYPVVGPGTELAVLPIPLLAAPTDMRTYSAYVNDTWQLSERLTVNLGLRWDKKDAKDPAGTPLSTEGTWSPRLAVTWDPTGKGTLRLTGSFGRYVSTISENQIFWVLPYGNTEQLYYFYDGPGINVDPSQPLVSRADALRQLFQWFGITASGQLPKAGIDPFSVSIPGLTSQLAGDLKSQRADEFTLGVNGSIGTIGSFRVEGAYRKYGNFYAVDLDTTT